MAEKDFSGLMEWDLYHKLREIHPDAAAMAGELVKRAQPWGTTNFEELEGRLRHVAGKMRSDVEEAVDCFRRLVSQPQCLLDRDWTLELVVMWSQGEGLGAQEEGMLLSACLQRLHLLKLLGEAEELLQKGEEYPDFLCAVRELREKIQRVVKRSPSG